MKKNGLLNSEITKVLADLRHTDQIIIGDCGLPVPRGVKEIDISLKLGVPTFSEVLEIVVAELAIEKIILATEIQAMNAELHFQVSAKFSEIDYVSHEEFKLLSQNVKAIIRTGENTPYANVILQSAVIF